MSTDPNESHDPYVETREGQLYVRGSDVRLERLILLRSRAQTPEALRDQFPSLSLAAIYGAIAYALSHKDEVDRLTEGYERQHPDEHVAKHWMGYTSHRVEGGERPHDVFDRDRFDKFDARARKTFALAQEEAQRFNHNYIGTEHLLLGLAKDGDSTAATVLGRMGVEPNAVRSAVEHIIGRGDRIALGDIGLTPRAKKIVELAVDEARRGNAHYIGTEHLLLGTIREGEGIAAGVLESLGVTYERAAATTTEVLREQGGRDE